MAGHTLLRAEAERLREAPFTYAGVGATRSGALPQSYGPVRRTSAVSRPAILLTRLGAPVSRAVQAWVTNRYLKAL